MFRALARGPSNSGQSGDLNSVLALAHQCEVMLCLHAQKRIRAQAERLLEADRHIRAEADAAVEKCASSLTRRPRSAAPTPSH